MIPRRLRSRVLAFLRSVEAQRQLATEREAADLIRALEASGWGRVADVRRLRDVSADRDRRKAARAELRAETSAIREAVIARSGGKCEVCGSRSGCTMDHFAGGVGRRLQEQSVENCWLLCAKDHAGRQANRPNAEHWNDLFAIHAARHGYPVLRHIEHQAVPR